MSAVDESLRSKEFGRSWTAIWSVRNRITHGYFSVDRSPGLRQFLNAFAVLGNPKGPRG